MNVCRNMVKNNITSEEDKEWTYIDRLDKVAHVTGTMLTPRNLARARQGGGGGPDPGIFGHGAGIVVLGQIAGIDKY
mgnify:CR=1 FL=1